MNHKGWESEMGNEDKIQIPERVHRDLARLKRTFPYRHCWAALPRGGTEWEFHALPTTHKRARQIKQGYSVVAAVRANIDQASTEQNRPINGFSDQQKMPPPEETEDCGPDR
jgi:hypothetical protein